MRQQHNDQEAAVTEQRFEVGDKVLDIASEQVCWIEQVLSNGYVVRWTRSASSTPDNYTHVRFGDVSSIPAADPDEGLAWRMYAIRNDHRIDHPRDWTSSSRNQWLGLAKIARQALSGGVTQAKKDTLRSALGGYQAELQSASNDTFARRDAAWHRDAAWRRILKLIDEL